MSKTENFDKYILKMKENLTLDRTDFYSVCEARINMMPELLSIPGMNALMDLYWLLFLSMGKVMSLHWTSCFSAEKDNLSSIKLYNWTLYPAMFLTKFFVLPI